MTHETIISKCRVLDVYCYEKDDASYPAIKEWLKSFFFINSGVLHNILQIPPVNLLKDKTWSAGSDCVHDDLPIVAKICYKALNVVDDLIVLSCLYQLLFLVWSYLKKTC